MNRPGFAQLQDVLLDDDFPALDLALRRGRHIDRDDAAWYELLTQAQEQLESFYRRYGCELVYKTDGYYFLLSTGDLLPRRHLSPPEMLVGQALALLYLDPAAVERGGRVTMEELVGQLASVVGTDALVRAFNPRRRRYDERVAQKTARARIAQAVRQLAALGFVDVVDEHLRLRPALLRFAEPVRGLLEPATALAALVARGEATTDMAATEATETMEAMEQEGEGSEPSVDEDGADEENPEAV